MTYTAWFDGSFVSEKECSIGFVVLKDKKVVHSFSAPVFNLTSSTETEAGLFYLLKFIRKQNLTLSNIFTDCEGIIVKVFPQLLEAQEDDPLAKTFLTEFSVDYLKDVKKLVVWKERKFNLADALCKSTTSEKKVGFYSNQLFERIKNEKLTSDLSRYRRSSKIPTVPVKLFKKRQFSSCHFSFFSSNNIELFISNYLLEEFSSELGLTNRDDSLKKIQDCYENGLYSRLGSHFFFYKNGLVFGVKRGHIYFYATGQTPTMNLTPPESFDADETNSDSTIVSNSYGVVPADSTLRNTFNLPKNLSIKNKMVRKFPTLPGGVLVSVYNRHRKKYPDLNAVSTLSTVLKAGTKYSKDGIDFYVYGKRHVFCIDETIVLIRDQNSPYVQFAETNVSSFQLDKAITQLNLPVNTDFSRKVHSNPNGLSIPILKTLYHRRRKSNPNLSFISAFQDAYITGEMYELEGFNVYVKGTLHLIVKNEVIVGFREQKSFLTKTHSAIATELALPVSV